MPDEAASDDRSRMQALVTVCVLAVASIAIALLGATPARVSTTELMGDARNPGDAAFVASHRGDSASAPENTLPAIEKAIAGGFPYVEVDVALTADGHAVLMHDRTVKRTTNGVGAVADLTLAQIRALDAGSWFDPSFAGTPVPTLGEFLDVLADSHAKGLIELKGEWDAAGAERLAADIAARGLEHHVAVASFDARTLAHLSAASPVIHRLAIFKVVPDDVVAAARTMGVGGILADRRTIAERPEVVDELHEQGMRVVVYTLNEDVQWLEATDLGVDGIVTDDPGSLYAWQAGASR
ncbi:MAG TPA: glycerophosphodiester phosphodiesterase family protein [Microbacterium sp.]|uniref:glycerophosphodiester phosphodiesterase n=1 Tax=Microbacterium sp. TaxID=51671 RepID=UPI002C3EC70C|nr:glycerophosphodiester phosphodiesterase family protein [Microbacterium sp.]HWI32211.1 glycerophosphodiester phosphodiesterase family protein [Microbacterium sp.]